MPHMPAASDHRSRVPGWDRTVRLTEASIDLLAPAQAPSAIGGSSASTSVRVSSHSRIGVVPRVWRARLGMLSQGRPVPRARRLAGVAEGEQRKGHAAEKQS
eukprot:scaffold70205_cov57-Phaeocystis_antarctica.AAC.3